MAENTSMPPKSELAKDQMIRTLQAEVDRLRKRDVSEREESRSALSESEEQFKLLVDSVKDYAIFRLDERGFITSWNRGAARIKGYSSSEVIGKHFSIFYTPEAVASGHPAFELQVARQDGRYEEEGWRVKKDGSTFWANVVITALVDKTGKLVGFAKVTRDMTLRKAEDENRLRLQEELELRVAERTRELQAAKEAADTANAAKTAFLANMSHEIRTPLGAVIGFSEMLIEPDLAEADRLEIIAAIKRNGDLLLNIINDILDLSKVEAGKLAIESEEVTVRDILTDVSTFLNMKALEKGIRLDISVEGVVPPVIQTDPLRLRQILVNIVGNAIKFTQEGRISVLVKMVYKDQGSNKLAFVVKDTGVGISPQHAAKLFAPFTQADDSYTREFGGTGLGLSLSKRLAQLLDGDVVLVESTPGQGSTFMITVDPGQKKQVLFDNLGQEMDSLRFPAESGKSYRLDGVRVLLVEDFRDNQVLVGRFLTSAGASVEYADNGQEALVKMLNGNISVVLMDLQMPVLDGYEATRALRTRGDNTPIIALTAHAMKEEQARCFAVGFNDYLSKPVERKDLLKKIASLNSKP